MGTAMGVLHTRGPEHRQWDAREVARARLVAAESGTRLGVLRAMAQTQLQASTDALTGMANRRTLEREVDELVRRGISYVVAMGDLDSFKAINDTFGHDSGDRAIRRFSGVLRQFVRRHDIVARYGGDEFVLVFPEVGEHTVVQMLDRVRGHLTERDGEDDLPVFTASFGVCASAFSADFREVLQAADRALLQAKRAGRNRVMCASEAVLAEATPDAKTQAISRS
jgi:diguanylate cyclase (GGDEF)-like protein